VPIRVRSSTCRTRKSATSARLIAPNRHACGLHGIDQDARGFREEPCAFEDQPRREVYTEGLDHHADVPEYVPDRVGIERVARHLIEV